MNISDEAVEAAGRAYRAKVEWIDRHSRDDYGREVELGVRAALEAAAPHLMAGAWDEGGRAAVGHHDTGYPIRNPYKAAP